MISSPLIGQLLSPLCGCGVGSPVLPPLLPSELEALTTFSAGFTRELGLAGPRTSLYSKFPSQSWTLGCSPTFDITGSGGGISPVISLSLSAGKVLTVFGCSSENSCWRSVISRCSGSVYCVEVMSLNRNG